MIAYPGSHSPPGGDGEVLASPSRETWAAVASEVAAGEWACGASIGGRDLLEMREAAQAEAFEVARSVSARFGLKIPDVRPSGPVAVTGHQPEFYHPGVWAKVLALDTFTGAHGGVAFDCVVDSDAFAGIRAVVPCADPVLQRCHVPLADGGPGRCYEGSPVPTLADVATFRAALLAALETLPTREPSRHAAIFCDDLAAVVPFAHDIAEAVVAARHRYERGPAVRYLELPITRQSRTPTFALFIADLMLRAEEVREAYNDALADYRREHKIRTAAQPFPDLDSVDGGVELPVWHIERGTRAPVGVRVVEGRVTVVARGRELLAADADPDAAARHLVESGVVLAPRAATLTLFERLFVADLFIHGIGGARYDRVTDELARRLYGVEPPPFVVLSLTRLIPLGVAPVAEADVDSARSLLQRLRHNPDEFIDALALDDAEVEHSARTLAARKGELVAEIATPGADRRSLGLEIRSINEELARRVEPLVRDAEARITALEEASRISDVASDRSYPFFCFDPAQVREALG